MKDKRVRKTAALNWLILIHNGKNTVRNSAKNVQVGCILTKTKTGTPNRVPAAYWTEPDIIIKKLFFVGQAVALVVDPDPAAVVVILISL